MARNDKGRAGFATSLIVGLLLIPISAVAAYAIVSGSAGDEPASSTVAITMAEPTTTQQSSPAASVDEALIIEPVSASRDDLEKACGEDGLVLVMAEADETISDVQQAALDALRQVCADFGLELPGPPVPEPVVRTVTIQASSSQASSPATTATTIAGGGDDHYEDDDHDEYEEDEYEEHEEDEHEEED